MQRLKLRRSLSEDGCEAPVPRKTKIPRKNTREKTIKNLIF